MALYSDLPAYHQTTKALLVLPVWFFIQIIGENARE